MFFGPSANYSEVFVSQDTENRDNVQYNSELSYIFCSLSFV